MTQIIHWRIAKIAKAMASEAYELCAREYQFYKRWPTMELYVRRNWQHYIPFARNSLYDILAKDYSFEIATGAYTDESVRQMKDEVMEVVLIDSGYKATAAPAMVN